jgi:NAD+ kinase
VTQAGIGLVVHHGRATALDAADRVRAWAGERGLPIHEIDVWAEGLATQRRRNASDEAEAAGHPSLIVTIGGDGTFLRGARVAAHDDVPVLGVNVGRVGFLTEVEPDRIEEALTAVFAGTAHVDERLMLTMRTSRPMEIPADLEALMRYSRGPLLPPPRRRGGPGPDSGPGLELDVMALNDIVFEKLARDRQASLGVYLNRTLFASYSADALIVSSPTGSTAYSFAAGGPVLSPKLKALVFTPVAPHMIFNRSVVLAGEEAVAVQVLERSGQVAVSVDGQLRGVLDPGDWVSVKAADHPARLIRLGESNFYERLRARFSLTDAPAAAADGRPTDGAPADAVPADGAA